MYIEIETKTQKVTDKQKLTYTAISVVIILLKCINLSLIQ